MFYHFFYPLSSEYSILNVFKYITFRSAYAGVTALTLSLIFGKMMIRALQKLQIQEKIRSDGPQSHSSKSGTPTMGGLLILAAFIGSTLLWGNLSHHYVWIVIFAAGTGNPFFTTDTAAALRAAEMSCDLLLKGTQVDGVYTADPKLEPSAKRYEKLSFSRVLREDLKVMDAAAISLARENNIPIMIFSIHDDGVFKKIIDGNGKYTLIDDSTE